MNTHLLLHYIKHFFVAKKKGHGVHSPLAYRLCEDVFYNEDSFYAFEKLHLVRKKLLINETELEIEDFGAGSKTFISNQRKIKDIAAKGISTAKQAELLFKLLHFFKSETIIELGTSLGLTTCYLASVSSKSTVYSIEGSTTLTQFAKALAKHQNLANIEFISGNFDPQFKHVLERIEKLDFLYVDGNHSYEASKRYFDLALTKKHNHSVFVFDDIYWSKAMTQAWNEIKQHPHVRLSIDTFYFGILIFDESILEKIQLKLFI